MLDVGRDERIVGVAEEAVEAAAGRAAERLVDLLLRRLAREPDDEVGYRPVGTGARTEMPSTLPFSSGMTSPIAFAAPVEVGIRLIAAARARRRSLCGKSRMTWSFVYAWIVVMKPCSIPNVSCRTFAMARRSSSCRRRSR